MTLWIPLAALALVGLAFLLGRRTKKATVLVARPTLLTRFADEFINEKAINARSATTTAVDQYRVTITDAKGKTTEHYRGPVGHTALQIFENVAKNLTAGELMQIFDGDVCRGEKRG